MTNPVCYCVGSTVAGPMETPTTLDSVVVYLVDRPSFDRSQDGPSFPWYEPAGLAGLDELLDPYDPATVQMFVDQQPAGPAWQDLLQGLVDGRFRTVVTHLAPLSSAQRQQLIGVCAVSGAHLVTPGSAGGGIRP